MRRPSAAIRLATPLFLLVTAMPLRAQGAWKPVALPTASATADAADTGASLFVRASRGGPAFAALRAGAAGAADAMPRSARLHDVELRAQQVMGEDTIVVEAMAVLDCASETMRVGEVRIGKGTIGREKVELRAEPIDADDRSESTREMVRALCRATGG